MTIRTTLKNTAFAGIGLAGAALLAVSAPLAANAHVDVTPSDTGAGAYTVLTFAVSHGCEGSPTTSIEISLPEEITSVTPTINPNWTVETVQKTLDEPLEDGHGNEITEVTGSVKYTAITPLKDGYRETFELSVQLPADAEGETLFFPSLQTCEVGSTDWSAIAEEGADEPDTPAPAVLVTASTGDGHAHEAAIDDEHADGAEHTDAATNANASGDADTLARVLGVGGLIIGAVGIVIALAARRGTAKR